LGFSSIPYPKERPQYQLPILQWDNPDLVYDYQLKCFYLEGNLVYFSRSAPPPNKPKYVYVGSNKVFRSDWENLPAVDTWKAIVFDREAINKHIEILKGKRPLPLQHHDSYPPNYYYDTKTRFTYHISETAQAVLCEDIHPFTHLVDVQPLRRKTFLDPIAEHQRPEQSTPLPTLARWRLPD